MIVKNIFQYNGTLFHALVMLLRLIFTLVGPLEARQSRCNWARGSREIFETLDLALGFIRDRQDQQFAQLSKFIITVVIMKKKQNK